jgi:pyruvate,water dikinase
MTMIFNSKTPLSTLERFAGGKATNMARLNQVGVPTPPWFCVSSEAFQQFLKNFNDQDLWSLTHAEIEKLVENAGLDAGLKSQIEAELKNFPSGCTFAVRSSGIGEDSAENSFAGQFSSYLNQTGSEQVLRSLKLCWASAFTERSRSYRKERNISTEKFSMGVVIQKMIQAEVAGVGFSRDPIHPLKRDQMIISSVYGIGEGLVSGELDADHYYVDRTNFKIGPHVTKKEFLFIKDAQGGIRKEKVREDKQHLSSLTDGEIQTISKALITLEDKLGLPQDIEWVFENKEFYCVQTRPITNLPASAFFDKKVVGDRYILWDNSNITESYNGVTTPLTFSHISRAYRQVYLQFCEVMGVPADKIKEHEPTFRNMLGLVRGRVYYNLRNWYQMLYLFPTYSASTGFMETMMGVKQGLKPEVAALFDFTKRPMGYSTPLKIKIVAITLWRIFKVQAIIDQFKADFFRVYNKALKAPYQEMSVQELINAYDHLNEELLFKWKAPIISDTRCMVFFGILKSLSEKWIKQNENPSLYNDLLSGEGDLPSTEPTRLLMKIARKVELGDPKLREWFVKTPTRTILQDLNLGTAPDIYADFQHFISTYGFRCINELKLESTDLHEDPTFAMDAIISFIKMKNINIDEIMERERKTRDAAEAIVKKNLSGVKLRIYWFILRHARRAVKDREDLRLLRTNIFGVCRRIFKALGDRYHELGIIDDPMHVFYLSIDEIVAFQEGRSFEVNFKEITRMRKKQFDEYRKTPQPPDRFVSEGAASLNFHYPAVLAEQDLLIGTGPVSDDPNVLIGTPCCPGVVEGIVRVVREAEDAEGLQGEIMVSERTDPGWVPLFPSTSGLLIERGSLLSHSAVVARELGIPTIVGVHGGLMKRLKTGMKVRMDAGKGEIRILE